MKKILLPLVALLLTASAASAQTLQATTASKRAPKASVFQGQKKAYAPTKADGTELTDEQRYIGNTGADTPSMAVGVPGATISEAGTIVPASVLKKYAGDKIIGARFCLLTSIGSTTVRVNYCNGQEENGLYNIGDEILSKELTETKAVTSDELVWNEVRFDEGYTIPAEPTDLKFGFDYTQKNTTTSDGSYTDECTPLWVNTSYGFQGGFILNAQYTDSQTGEKGYGWLPVSSGSSWVTLCMQVLVEREGGFVQDIVMGGISADKFAWNQGTFDVAFSCYNDGSQALSSYEIACALDGNEIGVWTPSVELTSDYKSFSAAGINVPTGTTIGTHQLSVYVKSMNGAAPTGDLSNDTLYSTLRVYKDCMKKQKNLVEQFTSQGCSNCPYGYDVLNALAKTRDDLAWVAIHNYYSTTDDDDYVCSDGQYISYYSAYGYPYASFNRYFIPNSQINTASRVAVPIGYTNYEEAADVFSQFIDDSNTKLPSFVNLNVTTNYDADNDGELTITVKGTGVEGAAQILKAACLTIYLTEDGQVGSQSYGSSTLKKYKHDHILRMVVTGPSGDAINWDGDNFEATYVVNVPDEYDYSQMHAIAFVNNVFAVFDKEGNLAGWNSSDEDVWVSNCNMVDITDGESTGIKTVVPSESKQVVARYAADGTQLSAPVKGVNIVKFSDGTSKTVLVK
jgi:hypothetical protein